jgi:hypothetical protein
MSDELQTGLMLLCCVMGAPFLLGAGLAWHVTYTVLRRGGWFYLLPEIVRRLINWAKQELTVDDD